MYEDGMLHQVGRKMLCWSLDKYTIRVVGVGIGKCVYERSDYEVPEDSFDRFHWMNWFAEAVASVMGWDIPEYVEK